MRLALQAKRQGLLHQHAQHGPQDVVKCSSRRGGDLVDGQEGAQTLQHQTLKVPIESIHLRRHDLCESLFELSSGNEDS